MNYSRLYTLQCSSVFTVYWQCSPVGAFLYSHLEHTTSHSINTPPLRIHTLMQTQCLTKMHVLALVISILCIDKNTVHWLIKTANANVLQINMQTGTLHLHRFKGIPSQRKRSSVYAYIYIFSLTTSRSPKLIPKADLKRECPYFYSNFFLEFRLIF